jgi:hypothetical protein
VIQSIALIRLLCCSQAALAQIAFRQVISLLRSPSDPTDGFVYVQGSLSNRTFQDSLFPGLNITTVFLYRKVEICQPQALGARSNSTDELIDVWIEESRLNWRRGKPDLLHESTNFTTLLEVDGLRLSKQLLSTGIFRMQRYVPRSEVSVPEGFTLQDRGIYFASAAGSMAERIRKVKATGGGTINDPLWQLAFSMIGGVVINFGDQPMRSGQSVLTDSEAFNFIMTNCQPGDIRMRHQIFRPAEVSIIGWKEGNQLVPKEVDGIKVGIIREGKVPPGEMFEQLLEVYEDDAALWKLVLSVGWIATVFIMLRDPIQRCLMFLGLAWAVLMLRSFVSQSGFLDPKIWGIVGLFVLPVVIKKLC